MIEFKLPSLGADMDQGRLLKWCVAPGQVVRRGQVVAVVDTSKAAVDVESWHEGTVHQLLVEPDQTVAVGAVLALFLASGEASASTGHNANVSPVARRRAYELDVDPDRLTGTGPQGAVTLADVERAAGGSPRPSTVPSMAPPPAGPQERTAEMRQTIAAAMSRSKREIPHYYVAESIPLRAIADWLVAESARRPSARRHLLVVQLLKAVAVTLRRFPELNGLFRGGAFEPARNVHVGVAIALRHGGLVAPALHDVADKSLDTLVDELGDLIRRARAGSLRSSELSDATVTVTSLGEQGVDLVQGIVYPPQVALVGFGRLTERPWVHDGAIVPMPVITASLAADHRVSDGHLGARFLAELRERLQQPEPLSEQR